MPFQYGPLPFTEATIKTLIETGGVYGLFQCAVFAQSYKCLYVGQSDNLRRRVREHFANPPCHGITHIFAEGHAVEGARNAREIALIREFNPPANVQHTR